MQYSNAASLARELMNLHGLGHWTFQFDRAKCRAGCCKYRRTTITLSEYYVPRNDEAEIRDTILHEIAHALAGPGQGHGPVWKAICLTIGAKPVRCYDNTKVDMPKGQWRANCPSCKKEFHRHRRPKNDGIIYCAKCGPSVGVLTYSCYRVSYV